MENRKKKKRIKIGPNQKKILLLLVGGLTLGLSRSPKTYFKVIGAMRKEWREINEKQLSYAIRALYKSKLVEYKENKNGTSTLVLTGKGKKKALTYDLDNMKIKKPKKWDGMWRITLFDIPESMKRIRNVFRELLVNMDFFEFQKSVFVHPYDCQNEIEYLIEFYEIRKYVRFIVAKSIDNELHLKKHFKLLKK